MALHHSIKLPLLQVEDINPFHSKGFLMFSGRSKGDSEKKRISAVAAINAFFLPMFPFEPPENIKKTLLPPDTHT